MKSRLVILRCLVGASEAGHPRNFRSELTRLNGKRARKNAFSRGRRDTMLQILTVKLDFLPQCFHLNRLSQHTPLIHALSYCPYCSLPSNLTPKIPSSHKPRPFLPRNLLHLIFLPPAQNLASSPASDRFSARACPIFYHRSFISKGITGKTSKNQDGRNADRRAGARCRRRRV